MKIIQISYLKIGFCMIDNILSDVTNRRLYPYDKTSCFEKAKRNLKC